MKTIQKIDKEMLANDVISDRMAMGKSKSTSDLPSTTRQLHINRLDQDTKETDRSNPKDFHNTLRTAEHERDDLDELSEMDFDRSHTNNPKIDADKTAHNPRKAKENKELKKMLTLQFDPSVSTPLQLVQNSTRVYAEIPEEELNSIRKDFLDNDEIDKLKIDVAYDESKKNLGMISRKDIDTTRQVEIDKIKAINKEILMIQNTYESDRLNKG